jgi:hypothetical protein
VSFNQFQKFMDDPDYPKEDKPDQEFSELYPLQPCKVDWYAAVLFCNWLSRKEGFAPCYELSGTKEIIRTMQGEEIRLDGWKLSAIGTGYRLPTEAEWAYACYAGTTTDFAFGTDVFGTDAGLLVNYANYRTSILSKHVTVHVTDVGGSRLPNGWGFFDMHGNLSEWCYDRYGTLSDENVSDPVGPSHPLHEETVRVRRGGSFFDDPKDCTSWRRGRSSPIESGWVGFRVARTLPNEPSAWKVQMHAAEKVTGPKSLDNPDFNGSFEQPACDEGTFATRIVGWTGSTNEHAFGVTREVVLPPIPDGRQVAFVNNFPTESGIPTKHAIATQLSDRLEANNAYKLSTYFGWRNDILESIGILELYVGGRPVDGEIEGGQLLASTWVDLKRGEFVLGSVKYVATAENAHLGEKLGIRLMGTPKANYFSQTNFDHVTLTITMPIEESADATSPANR